MKKLTPWRIHYTNSGGTSNTSLTIPACLIHVIDWTGELLTTNWAINNSIYAELSQSSKMLTDLNTSGNVLSTQRGMIIGVTAAGIGYFTFNKTISLPHPIEISKSTVLYLHTGIGATCNLLVDCTLYIEL